MNGAGPAVALLVLAATVGAGAVAVTVTVDGEVAGVDVTPWADARPGNACVALAGLVEVLDLDSIGDQAAIRARGSALADALLTAEGPTQGSQAAGVPAEGRPAASDGPGGAEVLAGRRILAVLDRPGATVAQLLAALAPVADTCGVRLPAPVPTA